MVEAEKEAVGIIITRKDGLYEKDIVNTYDSYYGVCVCGV